MIIEAIKNAIQRAKQMNWSVTYWAIDLHGVVFVPDFKVKGVRHPYPLAIETLQLLSKRPDIILILYSCSHPHEIEFYLDYFREHHIVFKYINENPEAQNTAYGDYSKKLYFNVLLEDKAGFNPERDWKLINEFISKHEN